VSDPATTDLRALARRVLGDVRNSKHGPSTSDIAKLCEAVLSVQPATTDRLRALLLQMKELIEDIYAGHRDKRSADSDWMNGVDEPCQWCVEAKAAFDELSAVLSAQPSASPEVFLEQRGNKAGVAHAEIRSYTYSEVLELLSAYKSSQPSASPLREGEA
jgi:hypothetical protein